MSSQKVNVIGAGLAGVEAAYKLANAGILVTLYEMKPKKFSPAHKNADFAELVCSNSLKSKSISTASGMLKEEMSILDSIVLKSALACEVPSGGALAVDRDKFSKTITKKIFEHPNIEVIIEEVKEIPKGYTIVATGPLTSTALTDIIKQKAGCDNLYFYDAAAPIVYFDSIDLNAAFFGARYQKGDPDYLNCPLNEDEYKLFRRELASGKKAKLHDIDKLPVYEGCMPIEELAKRGEDAIRYGPMRPVGFNRQTKIKPYAILQLRKETKEGKLYNMVGFQTNLTFKEQKRIFSLIKALKNVEFARYGVMHRNTFLNAPKVLNKNLSLKRDKKVFIAGQLAGVEGYLESAACGIAAAIFVMEDLNEKKSFVFKKTSMIGALINRLSDQTIKDFQPMGANMGILPPLEVKVKNKQDRYALLSNRGIMDIKRGGI